MLTTIQIRMVQSTWQLLVPIQRQVASAFYSKLFMLDPGIAPLFKGDLDDQGRKLTAMITTAVSSLDGLGELVPHVQALGRRHAGYGVNDAHYDTVGAALLWTLEQGLGSRFTPEVKTAWTRTYDLLASTMKAAARDAAA